MKYGNAIAIVAACAAVLAFVARDQIAPHLPAFLGGGGVSSAETASGTDQRKHQAGQHGGAVVTVAVATARQGSLPVLRQTIGSIVPIASTALGSPAAGIVSEILVKDGATVKAGDLLVRLDDRTINAGIDRDTATIAREQATLDDARANLQRVQTLSTAGAQTKQQYDAAVAAAKQAEAAIAVDMATLAADKVALTQTQIRAPFDGKLGVVVLSPGAYVAPGANVVTLTQMKPAYAEFTLPETDLDLARASLSAGTLTVGVSPMVSRGKAQATSGPIVFIDNAVDAASGTFKLRALLANQADTFWPGQSLDVEVNAGDRTGLVLVPAVAVQPQDDGAVCYVVKPDRTIEIRKVTVAFNVGDTAGITGGLKDGDIVVTEGQSTLTTGTAVAVAAAGSTAGKPVTAVDGAGTTP